MRIGPQNLRRARKPFAIGLAVLLLILIPHPVFAAGAACTATAPTPAPVSSSGFTLNPIQIILNGIDASVAQGAGWVLAEVAYIATGCNTSPDLSHGNAWFWNHLQVIMLIASWVSIPLVLAAVAYSALKGQPQIAIKSVFVMLPLSVAGTILFVNVAQMLIQVTDDLSNMVGSGTAANFQNFANNLSLYLTAQDSTGAMIVQPIVGIIGGALIIFFGFFVYITMLAREAAIYALAVFTPLAMASIVFPRSGKVAKVALGTTLALIFSKFFIVAILSMAVSAFGDFSTCSSTQDCGLAAIGAGLAMLFLAAITPGALINYFIMLLPAAETALVASVAGAGVNTVASIIPPSSTAVYGSIRRDRETRIASMGFGGAGGQGHVTKMVVNNHRTVTSGSPGLATSLGGASPPVKTVNVRGRAVPPTVAPYQPPPAYPRSSTPVARPPRPNS